MEINKIRYLLLMFTLMVLFVGMVSSVSAREAENMTLSTTDFLNHLSNHDIVNGDIITITAGESKVHQSYTLNASNVIITAKGSVTFNGDSQNNHFYITGNNVSLNGITFTNFVTNGYGGAIYWNGDNGKVSNCNFNNNIVSGDRNIYDYGSPCKGGAIYWNGGNGNIINCNFNNNKGVGTNPSGFDGGAIYLSGSTTININNCKFTNNTAGDGGAIKCDGSANITDCNFINSTATHEGGAIIAWWSEYGNIINCNFTDNTAVSGGATCFMEGNGNMNRCNFINNTAIQNGGAINCVGNVNLIITDCNFNNNRASTDGGAISCTNGNGNMNRCKFINNTAIQNGGAIYWGCTSGNINNCNFNNNIAQSGGAIYCNYRTHYDYGDKIVINSNFINNIANDSGAAIYWHDTQGKGKITDCNFNNNRADVCGGAIYWNSNDGNVTNCNFTKNSAIYGGAICWLGANGQVINCNIINNTANYGGAICWEAANGYVINCTLTNNMASYGGAICLLGSYSSTVKNSKFNNNYASFGSAILLLNYGKYNSDNANLINNIFTSSISQNIVDVDGKNLKISGGENALVILGENATIASKINITILDNTTKNIEKGDKITLTAVIKTADGKNNIIIGLPFKFTINGETFESTLSGTQYTYEYSSNKTGYFIISGICNSANVDFMNGMLCVLIPASVSFDIDNPFLMYGDNVSLSISATDKNNIPLNGTITILIDGKVYKDNIALKNGHLEYNITNSDLLSAGDEHNIIVKFNNVDGYVAEANDYVFVSQITPDVNLNVRNIVLGKISAVDVDVMGEGSTPVGVVTLYVDGVKYSSQNLNGGTVTFLVANLNTGTHTIKVDYTPTNGNYADSTSTIVVEFN